MFYKFSKSMFDSLILNGFHVLAGDATKKAFTEKTELIGLEKQSGSNLYIVLIHNSVEYDMDKLISELVQINNYLLTLPYARNYKQIFMLNILPTTKDSYDFTIDNLLQAPANVPDSLIYNIFWQVDLDNGKVTVGKNQPSKVLGVEKHVQNAIKLCFSETVAYPTGKTIKDSYNETIINYIKSKNIVIKPPYTTYILILIMTMMIIFTQLIDPLSLLRLGVSYEGVVVDKQFYRLVTSIFTHANIIHFLNNALGLYIFGSRIERIYGNFNMLLTFMLSALIGNLLTIELMSNTLSVGASGGIFGLMGFALCVAFLSNNILLDLDFNTIAVMSVFMLLSSFVISNVNYVAHIAGFLVGFIIALYFVYIDKKKEGYHESSFTKS